MTNRDFEIAQAAHLARTEERHLAPVTPLGERVLTRGLKDIKRHLALHYAQAQALGLTEVAACIETANCAIEDARTELKK